MSSFWKHTHKAQLVRYTWLLVPYLGPTVTDWTTDAHKTLRPKLHKRSAKDCFFLTRVIVVFSKGVNTHAGAQGVQLTALHKAAAPSV